MASVVGTRIILIRHGERDDPQPPPPGEAHLTADGLKRAGLLVHVLGHAKIDAIYTSRFARTKEMAKPLAIHLGLSPIEGSSATEIKNSILSSPLKTALVVGHSDSVPQVINLLGGGLPVIEDYEFDNMFVTTVIGTGKLAVSRLKYGVRSLAPPL